VSPTSAAESAASEPRGPATVRVGLIGGGLMAKTHSLAYASLPLLYGGDRLPRIVRRRVADVAQPLAEAAAATYGWDEATTDWREITRAPDIDVVDIATPNDTHAAIAVDAAHHGKHVFCEKPLSHQVDEAQQMYHAVREAGVTNQVDFVYQKWPAIQHAQQLVARGDIGQVRQLRTRYFHDYAADPALPISWRFRRSRAGAGSLGDLGSHLIDLARFLVGEPTCVMARTFTFVTERPLSGGDRLERVDVDDAAQVWLDFATGASATLETNWMATGHKTDLSFEVTGDRGALEFSWLAPNELRFYSGEDPDDVQGFRSIIIGPKHPGAEAFWPVPGQGLGWGDAFVISMRDFLASVAAGTQARPDFLDGLRAVEVVEAALASSTTRAWVDIRPTAQ
jgi:predicted dehydrogenase